MSKVLASDSADFQAGDIVTGGLTHWATHQLVKSGKTGVGALVKIDPKAGVPLSYYTGILGGSCHSPKDAMQADAVGASKAARGALRVTCHTLLRMAPSCAQKWEPWQCLIAHCN